MSQTQAMNYTTFAGVIVMVLGYFHVVTSIDTVDFILAAIGSIGSVAYNFYQRYQKGDLNLLGARK